MFEFLAAYSTTLVEKVQFKNLVIKLLQLTDLGNTARVLS